MPQMTCLFRLHQKLETRMMYNRLTCSSVYLAFALWHFYQLVNLNPLYLLMHKENDSSKGKKKKKEDKWDPFGLFGFVFHFKGEKL